MTNFKADKNSSVPIHHQLYLYIKKNIENGEFSEGENLPSESEMIKLYEVSRITIRRAIADLEHDNFVFRRRGSGTIVKSIKREREISKFTSFSGDAKVKGDKPGSIILKIEKVQAGVKVGEKLRLASKTQVYFLKRLRFLNGKIIALHETYIRSDLGFKIKNNDFDTNTSLYEFLEEKGIKLGSADETIEAKMSTNEVKHDLFLKENQPVIYKERVTFDQQGRPIEFSENTYIADSYKYYVHIVNVRGDKK